MTAVCSRESQHRWNLHLYMWGVVVDGTSLQLLTASSSKYSINSFEVLRPTSHTPDRNIPTSHKTWPTLTWMHQKLKKINVTKTAFAEKKTEDQEKGHQRTLVSCLPANTFQSTVKRFLYLISCKMRKPSNRLWQEAAQFRTPEMSQNLHCRPWWSLALFSTFLLNWKPFNK